MPAAQNQTTQAKGNKPTVAQPRPQVIITDIQVSQIDAVNYLLRVQSNGPLAFDRVKSKNTRQVVVQFHQARLGSLAEFQPPSFGAITLSNDTRGNVILTIDLASSSYRVVVSQGGNPNVVELRIRG